MTIVHVLLGVG